jgi:hypothetical protein
MRPGSLWAFLENLTYLFLFSNYFSDENHLVKIDDAVAPQADEPLLLSVHMVIELLLLLHPHRGEEINPAPCLDAKKF